MRFWNDLVESFKNNPFIKKLISTHKKYVELLSIFKSRAIILYSIATVSLLIRSIYFYNVYPQEWQSMVISSTIYAYFSISFGLLIYYYFVVLGYWDSVIKASFGKFVNIERIKANRERRNAYKPLFQQKLREAGLKDASVLSLLLITAWVGPLTTTIFKGPLLYPFVLWYMWFCWLQFYRAWRAFKFAIDNPAPTEYQYVRPKPLQDWLDRPFVYVHGNKGTISESAVRVGRLFLESGKRAVRHASSDPGRALVLFSTGSGLAFGAIGGIDYIASEVAGRTTFISRSIECVLWGSYSADVETRQRAGWLRFRNVELDSCVTAGTRRLDYILVEDLYDSKHEPDRVSSLEEAKSVLMAEKSDLAKQLADSYQVQLKQKDTIIEQKDTIIELMRDSTAKQNRIIDLEQKLLELDNKQ